MRLPPSPHHEHSHWTAELCINEGHIAVTFLKPQNSTSWQQSESECSCPCISYWAHQILIWCSTLSFSLEQSEHTGTVGWDHLQRRMFVCSIDLRALPPPLTKITSQNNGSFCWGQPQADLIVVSGKRLPQHPILFLIRKTELCCQLQRSKPVNLCQEAVLSMKKSPDIIEHPTVELPQFTITSWRGRSKTSRKKFWKLWQMHSKYSFCTYLWFPASDHFQSNSPWCLHPSLSQHYDK